MLLVTAAGALALLAAATRPGAVFATSLGRVASGSPAFLDRFWTLAIGAMTGWAVLLVVGAFAGRRPRLGRDLVLAAAATLATGLVIARFLGGEWPDLEALVAVHGPPALDPALRFSVPAATLVAASPHLTRPLRRLGHWLLALGALAAASLEITTPIGAAMGLLVAVIGATIVHLALGSSAGRPPLEAVVAWLEELGVPTVALAPARRGAPGVFVLDAIDHDGVPLVVKVLGRDASDGRLLATIGRRLWYRHPGSPAPLGRLAQVEHEALVTLLAGQAGVPTHAVVRVGITRGASAVLVLTSAGVPLADLEPLDATAATQVAEGVWAALDRLHTAGIAHGQVDAAHLVPLPDGVGLADFRGGSAVADEVQIGSDCAQAFVAILLAGGAELATRTAYAALGEEGVLALLPYLQASVLTLHQRQALKAAELDLDQVRADLARSQHVEPPALVRLRRVTVGGLLQTGLAVLAFWMLATGVGSLDLAELGSTISEASWGWVLAGFVVAQLPRFAQAITTLGASPVPLPVGPVYALQLAISYVNLAVPTSAARVAVNVRFFQRHGLAPGSAVAIGALDGFSGFIVQLVLAPTLLLLSSASIDLSILETPSVDLERVMAWVIGIGLGLAAGYLLSGSWRHKAFAWIKRTLGEGRQALDGLGSPRRLGLLFGGNLANELLFAMSLGCFVRAMGYPISIGTLVLINILVGLLAGLLPIPGGIGVFEGGITYGLVQAGMPETEAFASVMLYRLASFYLPPIWGFFAMRWLQRNGHV